MLVKSVAETCNLHCHIIIKEVHCSNNVSRSVKTGLAYQHRAAHSYAAFYKANSAHPSERIYFCELPVMWSRTESRLGQWHHFSLCRSYGNQSPPGISRNSHKARSSSSHYSKLIIDFFFNNPTSSALRLMLTALRRLCLKIALTFLRHFLRGLCSPVL